MGSLVLTNTFQDGNDPVLNPVGTELQENFDDVKTLLNSNLDGDNISEDAEVDIQKVETTDLFYAEKILFDEIDDEVSINVEDIVGSKLTIKNSNAETIFEIDSTGKIIIGA